MANAPTCHTCGYDLTGLTAESSCPECSTPIRSSLDGPRLVSSDRSWLKRLALGLRFIAFGGFALAVAIAGFLSSVALMVLLSDSMPLWEVVADVLAGLFLVGGALVLAGALLFSSKEPRTHGTESAFSPRFMLRYAAVAILGVMSISMLSYSLGPPLGAAIRSFAAPTAVAASAVATIAAAIRLRSIMRRVPDPVLAKRLHRTIVFLKWSSACAILAAICSNSLLLQERQHNPLSVFGCVIGLVMLAGFIGTIAFPVALLEFVLLTHKANRRLLQFLRSWNRPA